MAVPVALAIKHPIDENQVGLVGWYIKAADDLADARLIVQLHINRVVVRSFGQVFGEPRIEFERYIQITAIPQRSGRFAHVLGHPDIGLHQPDRILHQTLFPRAKRDLGFDQPAQYPKMLMVADSIGTDEQVALEL